MIVSLPSRNELLSWISQLTNNTVEKLEHLSDGLAFCEIFDKLYPKMINLNKLKKDPKIPLEKEKNFRVLLNAINQMGLCVAINIVDLSHGKVTAILELLQWFYKQYKNPNGKFVPGQEKNPSFSEPRMIKTYVGNLVDRQRSCQKQNENKFFQNHLASSRRSVDTKLMKKTVFEADHSVRSKSVRRSSQKFPTEKKEKLSKVKSIKLSKQKFEEKCQEKRQTLKKQLSEKMSGKKSEIKSEKMVQKQETFQEVLCKVLNSQKPQLQRKLIRVTEAAIEGNPQLQSKIRTIMETDSEKKQGPSKQTVSPDRQVRNILFSFRNTSEIGQNDTLESIPPDTNSLIEDPALSENKKANESISPSKMMQSNPQASKQKRTDQDKKETVKKSAMKSYELPIINPLLSQSIKPHHVSVQKERHIEVESQCQEGSHADQNLNQNSFSKEPQKCYLFNPHQSVQKLINPETHVTEKKVESQHEDKHQGNRRQVQSENYTSTSFSKDDKNVWKENQTFRNQNLKF